MKNSKKGISKLLTTDPRFAARTGVLESLRDQFPTVIEAMIKLLIAANKDCKNHLHEFAFDLDGIAHLHGRRLNSPVVKYVHPNIEMHPDYIANQRQRQEKLEKAALCLKGLAWDLCQLDLYHLRNFLFSYKTPTGRTRYDGPMGVIGEIDLAARIIAACEEAHSSIFKVPVKKRGRPPLRYVDATRKLIILWEKYAGEKVPISKTHQHKVTSRAAEFIRLGISLIDRNASDANAVTVINKARTVRHSSRTTT
jgi:hypothetical protein